jgi:hypothetical protein
MLWLIQSQVLPALTMVKNLIASRGRRPVIRYRLNAGYIP